MLPGGSQTKIATDTAPCQLLYMQVPQGQSHCYEIVSAGRSPLCELNKFQG